MPNETDALSNLFETIAAAQAAEPLYLVKWLVVFAVLVLAFYLLVYFSFRRLSDFGDIGPKLDQARAAGRTATARLVDGRFRRHHEQDGERKKRYWGVYTWGVDGRTYTQELPMGYVRPPRVLEVGWDKSPDKVFHEHTVRMARGQLSGCLYLVLIFASFALAGAVAAALGLAKLGS